jgi:hypothetical protein
MTKPSTTEILSCPPELYVGNMPEPMLKTRSHRMFQHKGVIIGFYYDTWEVFFSINPATIWFAKQDGLY